MRFMDSIPATVAISDARANLTEVVNAVRLQDRCVRLTRRGATQAAIVPADVLDLIDQVGGLTAARHLLQHPGHADS
jgi:prevent-host-death family protein